MSFEEVLDQAIEMLRRRGRLTYRALKRQFDLDDAYFEDLKEELIKGQQLARDENEEVLVWVDADLPTPEPQPISHHSDQPADTEEATPTPIEPSPSDLHTPEAERRQLTVMFCDLVDSTRLSGQLDPEDFRDVIRAYQETAATVIQQYDGHIAQYLGDGLLVYFGFPQAHEDDARRAVHSGLGIVDAMVALNTGLSKDKPIELEVRIAIHTGPVVVGDIGGGDRHEQLALGETPNLAARLEGLAAPNGVVISGATHQLVEGYFVCEALGEQSLKGIAQPISAYQVVEASRARSRLDVAPLSSLTPLVGRDSEVTFLLERWRQAEDGAGQVVLISGEAGIGKSRLVQVVKDHVSSVAHTRLECRSSPYFQNTALYPITDLLQRTLQWEVADDAESKLEKLEQALSRYDLAMEETLPLLASFLALPVPENRYRPLTLTPQQQRQKTLDTLVAMLLAEAERQPVLFIIEDIHWIDPTTLDLLQRLIDQSPSAALFTLLTCRPEFESPWSRRSYLTEVSLFRLTPSYMKEMVELVAHGKRLPDDVLKEIVEKTDGVPLFVEEVTKAIIESDVLKAHADHYELSGSVLSLAIPTTLHDSLMARLDRLVSAKGLAQLGAVIGRQFSYELLHAISQLDDATLQRELARLVEAEVLYQRGLPPQATYTFKHALIQDAAYQSLLNSTRQQLHQRIAQALEARFAEIVNTQPELLAHHYTEGGLHDQAIVYWHQAGQHANDRSAHAEAITHLSKGLDLLGTLPPTTNRAEQELALQAALCLAFMTTKGAGSPEVAQAHRRARELCQEVGDTPQLFPVLYGLLFYHHVRAEYQSARELGEQCLRLAQSVHDDSFLLQAHYGLWAGLFYLGELDLAHEHLEQGRVLYAHQQHRAHTFYGRDPGVPCHTFAARVLWFRGYPDQAQRRVHEGLALAQELDHAYTLAIARAHAATAYQFLRDAPATQEQAEAAIRFSTDQGFPMWAAKGRVLRGWAQSAQGQVKEGLAELRQGLVDWEAIGSGQEKSYFLALMAEACGKVGDAETGLMLLADALDWVELTGERFWHAELCRLQGEMRLIQSADNHDEAISCFMQALDIARHQGAKSLELRAATSLAQLWQQQGKRQEAYDLLAPIHEGFTEGFETADLKEAKALLNDLGA